VVAAIDTVHAAYRRAAPVREGRSFVDHLAAALAAPADPLDRLAGREGD
jgi:hypothetical protein